MNYFGIIIVAIIIIVLLLQYRRHTSTDENYDPGWYVSSGESKRNCGTSRSIPMLLDDSGTDNNFWLFDRHRDRINGLYRDAKWIRTGCCDMPYTYDKMLPYGSRLYVSGGESYDS